MKKILLTTLFSIMMISSYALVFTATVPEGTNECYIAGAFTGWSQVKMTKIADNQYQIDLPDATASQGYKYCSGPAWTYVEKDAGGGEIGDRKWAESDAVASWAAVYDPNAIPGDITITVNVPEDTPDGEVYIVGSFQGWDPVNANKLEKIADFVYRITISDVTVFNYKMLCGLSYVNEEVNASGGAISDRKAEVSSPDITITVERWKNTGGSSDEGYTYLPDNFNFSPLEGTRRIWVYLPPDYETNTEKRYSVFYMHDGQNVFENGGYGSWRVQDALNELYSNGKEVGIVVAIDNGPGRIQEYSPFAGSYGSGDGDKYLQAIITNIMPYINENYRTLTDRENTGICGSSMGGLISYYAALKEESLFGRIGVISPSFWYCKNALSDYVTEWEETYAANTRMYFICGDSESASTVSDMQYFYNLTMEKGFLNDNMEYEVVEGGAHNEASWAAQIGRVYEFLFNDDNGSTGIILPGEKQKVNIKADNNSIKIITPENTSFTVELYDITGKVVNRSVVSGEYTFFDLSKGVYIVKINDPEVSFSQKIMVY